MPKKTTDTNDAGQPDQDTTEATEQQTESVSNGVPSSDSNGASPADRDKLTFLDEVALRMFERVPRSSNDSELARRCYLRASTFLKVRDDVQKNPISVQPPTLEDQVLDDAFAPNLPVNHPINCISSQYGSLEKIAALRAINADPDAYGIRPDSPDHKVIKSVVEMIDRKLAKVKA